MQNKIESKTLKEEEEEEAAVGGAACQQCD